MSAESRAKMSARKMGIPRIPMTDVTKRLLSKAIKKYWSKVPKDAPRRISYNRGRTPSEETRRKLAVANKGKTHSEATRKKLSVMMRRIMKGKPSPRKGKHITEKHKQRIALAHMGRKHSAATRQKISKIKTLAIMRGGFKNPSYFGIKAKSGHFLSQKNGRMFFYRSRLELAWMQLLEKLSYVVKYRVECVCIDYKLGGIDRRYVPDLRVWYKDGSQELIECRPEGNLFRGKPVDKAKFNAARAWCKAKKSKGVRIRYVVRGYDGLGKHGITKNHVAAMGTD